MPHCSDCHGTNTAAGTVEPTGNNPWGPHGSTNDFILKGPWDSTTGANSNGICFRCHNHTNYATDVNEGDRAGFESGLSGSRDTNLHAFHAKRVNKNLQCMWCHVAVPHGWKNKALLVNLEDIGHIPALAAKQSRTMGWVDELATPEQRERFGAFMSEDLGLTLATYIEQAVKRSEYHKRFGNGKLKTMLAQAEHYGATPEDMELAKAYIDAVMGTHGYKTNNKLRKILGMEAAPPGEIVNPKLQRLMGIMMVYQNVRTLALSTLTSMADIIGIAVRTGDISQTYGAMKAGITAAYKHAQGEEAILVDMAEMLGTIDRHLTMEALNWEYGGVYIRGTERRINEGFFKVIGLQAWTRATRIVALEAAQRFLKRHIENPNQHSERFLSELGITPEGRAAP